jgi:hypothetical protein
MKKSMLLTLGLSLVLLLCPINSDALTVLVGDADGFGFGNISGIEFNRDDGQPADQDGNGMLNEGDFLPDFQGPPPNDPSNDPQWNCSSDTLCVDTQDGSVWEKYYDDINGKYLWRLQDGSPLPDYTTGNDDDKTSAYDVFDNRSGEEKNDDTGLQWTDVSLSRTYYGRPGYAKDAVITFFYDTTQLASDPYAGDPHYISFLYGDYDVGEDFQVKYIVGGQERFSPLEFHNPQAGSGHIGLAAAEISWEDIVNADGNITLSFVVPEGRSDRYVAFDYFALSHEKWYTPSNPVPEPATFLLLGLGLIGILTLRRRKQK